MAPGASEAREKDSPEILARVKEGLALVEIVARSVTRQTGRSVTLDELRSFGREGLLGAARTYEPSRGVPFQRWAAIRVRGAMIDGVRSMSGLPRAVYRSIRALETADRTEEAMLDEDAAKHPGTAEEADERLSTYMAGIATAVAMGLLGQRAGESGEPLDRRISAEEELARRELVAAVRNAIMNRPEAERRLLLRHYFDDVNFDEAAKEIGLSKSWASRLHARAVEAVARELRRGKITE